MSTGDAILFSGKGGFSDAIKQFTDSEFSHIGMVLYEESSWLGSRVLVTESTSLTELPDAIHKDFVKGVQIQYLSDRLFLYQGKAWWLPLKRPIPPESRRAMLEWIRKVHEARTPYDFSQAIGAGVDFWDRLFANRRDYQRLFCSEYYCRALQIADMVPSVINPSEQTPADCAGFECLDWPPVLIKESA